MPDPSLPKIKEPDSKTAEEALEKLQDQLMSFEKKNIKSTITPVLEVVIIALWVADNAQADHEELKKHFTDPPLEEIILMTTLALAFWATHVRLNKAKANQDPKNRKALLRRGTELQQLFAEASRYLWKKDPVLWKRVLRILQGRGYKDMTGDLPDYVALFRDNWEDANGNCRVKEHHLTEAEELAPTLLKLFAPEDKEEIQQAQELKDRAWTRLAETYEKVAKAGRYLYDEETADQRYPNLLGAALQLSRGK